MDEEKTNPESPDMQEAPVAEKPSSGSNLLVVAIVVLIVLILVAVFAFWGYGIYKARQSREELTARSPIPEITVTASETVTASPDDFIISDSDSLEITKDELRSLSEWELKIARNEIYARHGRTFEHKDLQCYFDNQAWYRANPDYSDDVLSTIENKNIATILAYEQEIDSSYLNYDSGCSSL